MPYHPNDQLEDYRAAFLDGELVAVVHVRGRTLHYGQASLKVACLGSLVTHPHYRGRGYASAVLRDALTYIAEQGAHIALLDGVADFFDEYGFTPVWPRYTLQAPSDMAAELPQSLGLRPATVEDAQQLAMIYNRHWGARVTFSRKPALWAWRITAEPKHIVAYDREGRIQGYLWHDDTRKSRVEVVANTAQALETFLAYEGQRWQARKRKHFMWSLPPDDVIVPYAQQMVPITLAAHYFPSGSWLARIIDSAAMVAELLPEITAQAKATDFHFQPESLVLDVGSDQVDIGLRDRPETHCKLPLRDFVQVLFGSLRPEMLAVRGNLQREAVATLAMLFPPRVASIGAWDWF